MQEFKLLGLQRPVLATWYICSGKATVRAIERAFTWVLPLSAVVNSAFSPNRLTVPSTLYILPYFAQKTPRGLSGLPQAGCMGRMLGLNDHDEVFVTRLMPRVGVPPQIPFRHGIEKVKIGIFLNANHLPAYLKGAVRVVRVNKGKRDARITLEIPKLLAGCGLTETEHVPVPVKPDLLS
jgi:hypothetical protein